MYKTIEESFNFIARDSSALFYFTEPRSLRNILLYNNDFIYICTFLEDSVNADGCIHFKTILSQFRDEIRKSVEEMISIEIVRLHV